MNIVDSLFDHARDRPHHPAVEDGARIISYAALATMVDRAAAALRERRIGTGDIVIVALPDTAEHLAVLLALAKLGAVSFSIDERTPTIERTKAVEGLTLGAAIVRTEATGFLDARALPVAALFAGSDDADAGSGVCHRPAAAVGEASPLMVIQSSGTTGAPKRLILSHRQLVERNRAMAAMLGLSASERYLQVPYLRFAWGREVAFLMIMLGATIVLNHSQSRDDYLRYFSERGITYVSFTPFHLRMILAGASSETPLWPTLKIGLSSAPATPRERLEARRRLTPHLFEIYGTNEVADLALATPDDQDRYPESCGRVLDWIEAQIVDPDGALLPFGEVGEIRFRGPWFPHEYAGNAEATARHFRDGWFYPGDLASMNERGYVFLKGRVDQVINNAGAKYFPSEVEEVLLTHPAVVDVAVLGGPHPRFGEASVAYVVRSSPVTPNELHEFCRGKLAMHKAPQWVFFLKELPRVATGKPDKRSLKDAFIRYLEAQRQKAGSSGSG